MLPIASTKSDAYWLPSPPMPSVLVSVLTVSYYLKSPTLFLALFHICEFMTAKNLACHFSLGKGMGSVKERGAVSASLIMPANGTTHGEITTNCSGGNVCLEK